LKGEAVTSITITKTIRSTELPHFSLHVFLDSFIHEVSILLKLFGKPEKVSYDKENTTLLMYFEKFNASLNVIKPQADEKMRRFAFDTVRGGYIWDDEELYEKGNDMPIYKASKSSLSTELDVFLNHYGEWGSEIQANNQIAVLSVKILEEIFS
jgi:hypothetical protein